MKEKVFYLQKVPSSVPTIHIIKPIKVDYSEVKLYIPKETKYGRKVPSLKKP